MADVASSASSEILRFLPAPRFGDYEQLVHIGEEMAQRAGQADAFAALDSALPVVTVQPVPDTNCLAIDIGGTHSRAALRKVDSSGGVSWHSLFDYPNKDLVSARESDLFSSMCTNLIAEIVKSLADLGVEAPQIQGVSVVWSNALVHYALSGQMSGNSGKIIGLGKFYQKNEPWNPSLYDERDIGIDIIKAFERAGFNLRAFTIGNDTFFAQKAYPGAASGVVLSTGSNSTLVIDDATTLCNGELGNSFVIPEKYLHKADCLQDQKVTLETLTAGPGLARRFKSHLLSYLSSQQSDAAEMLKNYLVRGELDFRPEDISALLDSGHKPEVIHRELKESFEALHEELILIAQNLVSCSGTYAGLLCYLSVFNQLMLGQRELVVAIDSSQARFVPGYFESLKAELGRLVGQRFKESLVSVKLLEPLELVSVPMLGAANSLNSFL